METRLYFKLSETGFKKMQFVIDEFLIINIKTISKFIPKFA